MPAHDCKKPYEIDVLATLKACGLFLFGEHWKMALAAVLDVRHDTVQGWAKGKRDMRAFAWIKIHELMIARFRALNPYSTDVPYMARMSFKVMGDVEALARWAKTVSNDERVPAVLTVGA